MNNRLHEAKERQMTGSNENVHISYTANKSWLTDLEPEMTGSPWQQHTSSLTDCKPKKIKQDFIGELSCIRCFCFVIQLHVITHKNTHVLLVSAVKHTGTNLFKSRSWGFQLRVSLAAPFCSSVKVLFMFGGPLTWKLCILQENGHNKEVKLDSWKMLKLPSCHQHLTKSGETRSKLFQSMFRTEWVKITHHLY